MSRLSDLLRGTRTVQLLMEMALIVAGVLLAFQVDRWYESQKEAEQIEGYLARLIGDVEEDIEGLKRQEANFAARSRYT